MAYDEQEKELMAALQTLVAGFGNYDPPRLRKDGDQAVQPRCYALHHRQHCPKRCGSR